MIRYFNTLVTDDLSQEIRSLAQLFLLFLVIDLFLTRGLRTINLSYENDILLKSFYQASGLFGILLTVLVAGSLAYRRILSLKWNQLEYGQTLKVFVCFLALLMTWFTTTLEFNYFFNQGYYADRIVLIVLALLSIWRPFFIVPQLLLIFLLLWQLNYPVLNFGSHFAHKLQVLHILNLFAAWLFLHALKKPPPARHFLFFTACLVASAYVLPAYKKISIEWLSHGELYMMLLNAHAHGWLSFIDSSTLIAATEKISKFDFVMKMSVIAVEAGCLVFVWKRGLTIFLLGALMIFHCGVFLLYGYFFWTWIALNGALIFILLATKRYKKMNVFTPFYLALSIPLILTSKFWANPSTLGWIDGRISYTYRYEVLTDSGKSYSVPFEFFEPYGDVFTMSNFSYLIESHNMLANPYGSTSREPATALLNAQSMHDVELLESSIGWNNFHQTKSKTYRNFVQTYFANRNNSARRSIPYLLSPPRQFWTYPRGDIYNGQEPAKTVVVNEVTTLFDGKALKEIRTVEIMKIPIPDSA